MLVRDTHDIADILFKAVEKMFVQWFKEQPHDEGLPNALRCCVLPTGVAILRMKCWKDSMNAWMDRGSG